VFAVPRSIAMSRAPSWELKMDMLSGFAGAAKAPEALPRRGSMNSSRPWAASM
jgi:hypothetical protein